MRENPLFFISDMSQAFFAISANPCWVSFRGLYVHTFQQSCWKKDSHQYREVFCSLCDWRYLETAASGLECVELAVARFVGVFCILWCFISQAEEFSMTGRNVRGPDENRDAISRDTTGHEDESRRNSVKPDENRPKGEVRTHYDQSGEDDDTDSDDQ